MGKYFKDPDYASLPPIEVSYDERILFRRRTSQIWICQEIELKNRPAVVEITANPSEIRIHN
jgi:hypothetical protein